MSLYFKTALYDSEDTSLRILIQQVSILSILVALSICLNQYILFNY
jgi:hypothetical protein